MTTAARVRLWIAAALLIIGVTVPLAHRRWLETRIFEPLDKPITLSKGHLSTGDFYINLPETYRAVISVDYPFTYTVSNPPCPVDGPDSVMKFQWVLFRDGVYLGEAAGDWFYSIGTFEADKPGLYRIDIVMLSDATCANAGHPSIMVYTDSGEYEDRQLLLSWFSFFLILGAFGLTAHTAIYAIRDRKLTSEPPPSVLEPQDERITPPLRRFPPIQRFVGLQAFGIVTPMFLLGMLVIFITMEMNRPIPKGHWAFLAKHPPVRLNSAPPLTIYIGYGKGSQPQLFLNDKEVPWEQFEGALKNELKTRADWIVYIDANPDTAFADIASAIDIIHRMHAKAALVTSRDPSPEMMAHYDVKRCAPQVEKQPPSTNDDDVRLRKGEKVPGSPVIAYEVLESGETSNIRLERSSGKEELDKHALDWVRSMRFNRRPGCGVIESKVSVDIHWR